MLEESISLVNIFKNFFIVKKKAIDFFFLQHFYNYMWIKSWRTKVAYKLKP